MKTLILVLAAVASTLPAHALAARPDDPQQVMGLDLNACARPVYPAAALAQRAGGKTTVEVRIGDKGIVTDARVAASSGRPDLDEAALTGIRQCTFHAVLATGLAPTGWIKTQYVWVIDGAAGPLVQDPALFDRTKARADSGDAQAQNLLGTWYEHGTRVKKDPAQAAAWYLLAAQNGNAYAQNNLGVLYSRGVGVPRDPRQAADWYAKAAEQGHLWGQANLALAHESGIGAERDSDKALAWITRSAEGGLPFAQLHLGMLTMQRAANDDERAAAAAWIARAAAQDYAPGAYYLGRSFELGLGNVQDPAQAAALYRKALDKSGGRAETALGMLLEAGRAGVGDPDEAAKLYLKAMRWRYPPAYYRYGLILEQRGDIGLATAVYRQGADLGHCEAVVKYAQLRSAENSVPGAGPAGIDWDQRARSCQARSELPAQLQF